MTAVHTRAELSLLKVWEQARPASLRQYDQIPMLGSDLLSSVKAVAPALAGQRVAFMGDHDGVSVLLGLLAAQGLVPGPAHLLLLDFDERLLLAAMGVADHHHFSHLLDTQLYNAFDPLPPELLGQFSAFYTNPPYGASNDGASVRLFATRGAELADRTGATGYVVLPDDPLRPWTTSAARSTQAFLNTHGWTTLSLQTALHSYHLDDDPELKSALLTVKRQATAVPPMPWARRQVDPAEVPAFYGQSQQPPYPRFISAGGRTIWHQEAAS